MIVRRVYFTLAPLVAAVSITTGCAPVRAQAPSPAAGLPPGAPVVEVIAEDFAFKAPEAIPSGWTTIRFTNEGEDTHFVALTRLPEGKTYDEYVTEVAARFNDVWYPLRSGEIDKAKAGAMLGEIIPAWFWTAEQMGGPGLVAPGGTAQATLNLKPGNYVMECYMKTSEGEFHAMEGMARPLVVTDAASVASAPAASVEMTLSNRGIAAPDVLTPGRHTVAVHFAEHPEMAKNDVHLVRLGAGTSVAEIVPWMDWLNVQGLQNPAPATFLSGTHEMPVGYTAYVTVELPPGRYAWISEATGARGVLKEFTVR